MSWTEEELRSDALTTIRSLRAVKEPKLFKIMREKGCTLGEAVKILRGKMMQELQIALEQKNIPAKILYIEQTKQGDYEVVYTFDLNYKGRDYSNLEVIIEPELDELVEDIEEAVYIIENRYNEIPKGGVK